jgi:hypothetical protein
MHDADDDELMQMLGLVENQTHAMIAAAKVFQLSPRDGLQDLETGRPLLRDLRSLAHVLSGLADALKQTADRVQRQLMGPRHVHRPRYGAKRTMKREAARHVPRR